MDVNSVRINLELFDSAQLSSEEEEVLQPGFKLGMLKLKMCFRVYS